jgi:phage terminase large subunit
MVQQIKIDYVDKLTPVFTKPKRIKIIVGGRGSTKTTGAAGWAAVSMMRGELWCCARETLNSIEESVHRMILAEIDRHGLKGFEDTRTAIRHASGGRAFYRGLSRNISSLKSTLSGVDVLWIEEGQDLSEATLTSLTASVRLDAAGSQRLLDGEDVKMPEIIITMNRGSSGDPVAKKWLARAEPELRRCGYYEDDLLMVVEVNYTDMPESWFLASGLEKERLDDWENLSRAAYDHKWHGHYLDTVADAIIKPEWFDAAIDAHLIDKRAEGLFKPHGAIIVAHDPFDDGEDAGGLAIRHGSIIQKVESKKTGEIDVVCDWATGEARKANADWFVWDGDGMGTGLKRQISTAFQGTRTRYHMFRGSLSGSGQDNAGKVYMKTDAANTKTYADTFKNNRAQYYIAMANRFKATYDFVVKGKHSDPAEMISLNSEGISDMVALRSEICRIPRKPNANGLEQIMSKDDMRKAGIPSPNMSDAIMMSMFAPPTEADFKPINFEGWR